MRYLTKDWYIACQTDPMTPEVQKRLDEIDRAYCAAQTREALPDGLLRRFFFHDGAARSAPVRHTQPRIPPTFSVARLFLPAFRCR